MLVPALVALVSAWFLDDRLELGGLSAVFFVGVVAAIWLIGFLPAMALFFPVFLILIGKAPVIRALILTASALAFIYGITTAMSLRLPEGLILAALA